MDKYIITSDGAKIFYSLQGTGPILIFLHGNSQTSKIFRKQIEFFSPFYTCLALDTRAHGRSLFRGGKKLTFERLAQDLLEVMQNENITQANILGFSDGANIAMVFASSHPEMVDKLILNAGNMVYSGLYIFSRFSSRLANLFAGLLHLNKSAIRLLLEDTGLNYEDLSKITARTLVLNGQFDVVKSSHAKKIAASIPHAKLIIPKFASHLFFVFQPKRFFRIIRRFLKE